MHGVGRNPARRFRLPVSGLYVMLSPLTGAEEILLAEGSVADPMLTLDLIGRIALAEPSPDDGDADWGGTDWAALTVTDIDTILMRLRQFMLGGTVSARTPRAPVENASAHDGSAMDRLAGRHQVAVLAAHS